MMLNMIRMTMTMMTTINGHTGFEYLCSWLVIASVENTILTSMMTKVWWLSRLSTARATHRPKFKTNKNFFGTATRTSSFEKPPYNQDPASIQRISRQVSFTMMGKSSKELSIDWVRSVFGPRYPSFASCCKCVRSRGLDPLGLLIISLKSCARSSGFKALPSGLQ